jgi:hypothetical protein
MPKYATDYTAAATVSGADLCQIVQGGVDKKATLAQIAALATTGSGVTITTKTASATLALADGDWIEMDVATANTLTVPPNSTVAFPIGAVRNINQRGAGQTTVVAGAGVTIRTDETLKLRKQWATAVLVKRATDEWVLAGSLEAAP